MAKNKQNKNAKGADMNTTNPYSTESTTTQKASNKKGGSAQNKADSTRDSR